MRSVRTPAAHGVHVHRRRGHHPVPQGHRRRGRSSASGRRAGRSTCPSRGADPQLGVPTTEQVELPHVGTLTSFCVVNVAFYGQGMEIPYTVGPDPPRRRRPADHAPHPGVPGGGRPHRHAASRPCGSTTPTSSPTLESIKYFRPNGEPDVDGRPAGRGGDLVRDIAVIAFAQMPNVRARDRPQRGRDAHAGPRRTCGPRPASRSSEIGFTCSGSTDYLSGPGLQLRVDPRRRRPVAAHPGEPRRDGRRLGALRGVGEAPARRVDTALVYCYGKSSPGPIHEVLSPPARPVQRRPALARRHQPGRPAGPRAARRGQGHRGRLRRGRRPQPPQRHRQPERPAGVGPARSTTSSPRSRWSTRSASTTARRSPTAPAR